MRWPTWTPCAGSTTARCAAPAAWTLRQRAALRSVRDLLRFAVSRFNAAQLAFGHGSDNAYDEAAYLILHTLHLPLDRLEPFLDAVLLPAEIERVLKVVERRVAERIPAAYLTHEAWLGELPLLRGRARHRAALPHRRV